MPEVSICIPVLNGGDLIERAIRSAVAQTYRDIEVVISDNASSDDTGAVCKQLSQIDKRIRYFRNDETVSIEQNQLRAVSRAEGKYCCVMGHDDELKPSYVSRLLDAFSIDGKTVLVSAGVLLQRKGRGYEEIRFSNGCEFNRLSKYGKTLLFATKKSFFCRFRKPNLMITGLFDRKLFFDVLSDQTGRMYNERDTLTELSVVGEVTYVDEVLFVKHTTARSNIERNIKDEFSMRRLFAHQHPYKQAARVVSGLLHSSRLSVVNKFCVTMIASLILSRRFGLK